MNIRMLLNLWVPAILSTGLSYATGLQNGGFESGLTDWTANGNVSVQSVAPYSPREGTKLIAFNAVNSANGGSIRQEVDVPNTLSRIHRLRLDVGNLGFVSRDQKLQVDITEEVYGVVHSRVHDVFLVSGTTGGATHWEPCQYEFPNPVTGKVVITLTDVSDFTDNVDLVVDNLRLDHSFYLNVESSLDTQEPGVTFTLDPESVQHGSGGITPASFHYFPGTIVTIHAPAVAEGKPFLRWTKDGVDITQGPSATVTMDADVVMKALYDPPVTLFLHEDFIAGGFVGTGPFAPLSRFATLRNESAGMLRWDLTVDTGGSVHWLTAAPSGGSLAAGQYGSLKFCITADALNLPTGIHTAFVKVTTPTGDVEQVVSIRVKDPENLVMNGSFESGLDAWISNGNTGIQSGAPYTTADGLNIVAFNSSNSTPNGSLTQSIPTEPGTRYALDFHVGVLSYIPSIQQLRVKVEDAAEPGNMVLLDETIVLNGAGAGTNQWQPRHYEFTAQGPETRLVFSDVSTVTHSVDLLLDHVRVSSPDFNIVVTTPMDENDAALGLGAGDSLREAISEAERRPGTNAIRFNPALSGQTLALTGTQLETWTDLSLDASDLAEAPTLSGESLARVFKIGAGAAMRNLNIRNGNPLNDPAMATGGGILNTGNLLLENCAISNNTASGSGGGISSWGDISMLRCQITDNHSGSAGGGEHNLGTTLLQDSTISGNTAAVGGGLSCQGGLGSARTILERCAVSGNTAVSSGGGYSGISGYKMSGVLHTADSTFSGNHSTGSGAAIYGNGIVTLSRCTVSGNSSDDSSSGAGGIIADSPWIADSIIAGNLPDSANPTQVLAGNNWIGGDPRLQPLGAYGGPTATMPPRPGSPVIDAVSNPPLADTTDQRGEPRISGTAMDIGAVELQQRLVTTLLDENDGLATGGVSLRDAVSAQSTDPVELIRFQPGLAGGTISLTGTPIGIYQNASIDAANLPGGITVSGNDTSGVFRVLFSSAHLAGLTVTGSEGSAIESGDAQLDLTDCRFHGNHSAEAGAALVQYGSFNGSTSISRCLFENNTSDANGGAISNSALLWITDSSFLGNTASTDGGAIWSGVYRAGMVVVNSTFYGNTSAGNGGAIHAGSAKLVHTTVSGNSASAGSGGGIASSAGSIIAELGLSLGHCIIAGNSAATDTDITGPIHVQEGANLIGGNPMLAPPALYDSSTPTMPPLPGSPAIDQAALPTGNPPFDHPAYQIALSDQRGIRRPIGPLPDLGATEAFPFSSIPAVDADSDGIDDRLEPVYQMNVGTDDSSRDTDGDGSFDAEEIANMTNPTDGADHLKITSILPGPDFDATSNPVFDVTHTCFPGLSYSMECSDTLEFRHPAIRTLELGVSNDFSQTIRMTLHSGRDFVRVRRNP